MSNTLAAKNINLVSEVADPRGGELTAAVSVVGAQLTDDLHVMGCQLSNIEVGHRALLRRLQCIAEEADERAWNQYGSFQEQVEDARREMQSLHKNLEDVFVEQLQVIRNQCESTQRQLHKAEHQLHRAEARVRVAEGQLPELQRQLVDAVIRIKSFEPDIAEINVKLVDQAIRSENVEVTIGEVTGSIGRLDNQLFKLTSNDERITGLHAMLRSARRMQRAAFAASIMSLSLVVYTGLGWPGWPTIEQYFSLLVRL